MKTPTQLNLPFPETPPPWWGRLLGPILAALLHYANSRPPFSKSEFYAVKKRLIQRFGTWDGDDLQHIVAECWGYWSNYGDESTPCGPDCRKCGGTGIYRESWHILQRYTWHGYKFHVWHHQAYSQPQSDHYVNRIVGRVTHRNYGRWSDEAVLWLYLLTGEWSLLKRALCGSRIGQWTSLPMLNLQKICMTWSMWFSRRTCRCGRRYFTWNTGWQICQKCRRKSEDRESAWESEVENDVPF